MSPAKSRDQRFEMRYTLTTTLMRRGKHREDQYPGKGFFNPSHSNLIKLVAAICRIPSALAPPTDGYSLINPTSAKDTTAPYLHVGLSCICKSQSWLHYRCQRAPFSSSFPEHREWLTLKSSRGAMPHRVQMYLLPYSSSEILPMFELSWSATKAIMQYCTPRGKRPPSFEVPFFSQSRQRTFWNRLVPYSEAK
jgi:hypothetical protein